MPEFEIEFLLDSKRYRVSGGDLNEAILTAEAELRQDLTNISPDCRVRELRR